MDICREDEIKWAYEETTRREEFVYADLTLRFLCLICDKFPLEDRMKEVNKRLMTIDEYSSFIDDKIKGKKNRIQIMEDLIKELECIEIIDVKNNEGKGEQGG